MFKLGLQKSNYINAEIPLIISIISGSFVLLCFTISFLGLKKMQSHKITYFATLTKKSMGLEMNPSILIPVGALFVQYILFSRWGRDVFYLWQED